MDIIIIIFFLQLIILCVSNKNPSHVKKRPKHNKRKKGRRNIIPYFQINFTYQLMISMSLNFAKINEFILNKFFFFSFYNTCRHLLLR